MANASVTMIINMNLKVKITWTFSRDDTGIYYFATPYFIMMIGKSLS